MHAAPAADHGGGRGERGRVAARVAGERDEVGGRAGIESRQAEVLARAGRGGGERGVGRYAVADERGHLVADAAVRLLVRPGQQRDAELGREREGLALAVEKGAGGGEAVGDRLEVVQGPS